MVKRVLCPFCTYGCEMGIEYDDFGIKGVEYLKDTPNQGRLCPRGSAAARYLNHPMRLTVPYKDGYRDWKDIHRELQSLIVDPCSVAVTFDRNITAEEYEAIVDFCGSMGIENVASTYFEPEVLLDRFFDADEPFTLEQIASAEMIVVIGDLFNQSPVISRHLINWKLGDRKHRLVVIDCLRTHTAYFASDFIKVKPGTEALLFYALSGIKIEGLDLNGITGVPRQVVDDISSVFSKINSGIIIACLGSGRTFDPILFAEGLARFGEAMKKKVVPFVEFRGFQGRFGFGSIMDMIKKKKIRGIINFGELFPFFYPQVEKELGMVSIYACSTMKYRGHTQIPFALNMEKQGSVFTTFGIRRNSGEVAPPSGVKNAIEILRMLGYEPGKAQVYQKGKFNINVPERIKSVAQKCVPSKNGKYRLFGEKIAYNFMTIFESDYLKICPEDAKRMGVRNGDLIVVESKRGKAELPARISAAVSPGVLMTTAESTPARGLFEFEVSDDFLYFVPTEVEAWLKE